jgi:O-antigen/teichoic acid export membrane protein
MMIQRLNFQLPTLFTGSAIKGAFSVGGGQAIGQVFRLAGNLLMARWLAPESFGLLLLVHAWITGLQMLSDVGIAQALQRSPRWNERRFQDALWSLQLMRGVVLGVIGVALAPLLAITYGDERLTVLMMVAVLALPVGGLCAMEPILMGRRKKFATLSLFELKAQIAGTASAVIVCYLEGGPLGLAIAPLVSALVRTASSYRLNDAIQHHWTWDKNIIKDISSFGRWIFISTLLCFLASHMDKLLLGKLLSTDMLGVFAIAAALAEFPRQMLHQVSARVLFPLVSSKEHISFAELLDLLDRRRFLPLLFAALSLPIIASLAEILIQTLYDERYQDGGWMLQWLLLGLWPSLLSSSVDPVLYIRKLPKGPALGHTLKLIHLAFLPWITLEWGLTGLIVWVSLRDIPFYVVIQGNLRACGGRTHWRDLQLSAVFIGSCVLFI